MKPETLPALLLDRSLGELTPEVEELLQDHLERDAAAARQAGMRTLAEDGWRLVRQGITTVEEILSVTTAKEVARTTRNETLDAAMEVKG